MPTKKKQSRTFKIQDPIMSGSDVKDYQQELLRIGQTWGLDLPLKADGDYGMATRSIGKMIFYGRGYSHSALEHGVTPELRIQLRNPERRSQGVKQAADSKVRRQYRDDLRKKFDKDSDVASPISKITTMTWGYHAGVHDGVDLICGPNAPLYAICDAEVIDVRPSGWWGNNPSGDVWRGDGIIQIEAIKTVGPIKKGMHFGYGHAEGADVKVGEKVQEGDRLGEAGLAVAWHCHFMANTGNVGLRGVGTFDPRRILEYAIKNS